MKKFLCAALLICLAMPAFAAAPFAAKKLLTATSPTACTSIQSTGNGVLMGIVNTGAAQTVFLTVYDEGATPTCAAADVIYGDGSTIALGAGASVILNIPVSSGIAYKLSGAITANVVIVHQ